MKGVLLINLGTPNSPSVKDVRNYLREFLFDPYVIDINPIARWLLLNIFILPTRPKKSAAAYQSIWTEQGSPLLVNSQNLANNAQKLLGDEYQVALGMRYAKPTIKEALMSLAHCEELIILPLFPQYSEAATRTAIERALKYAKPHWPVEQIAIIRDFYAAQGFISAQSDLIKPALKSIDKLTTKIIFSYHGLPERQIKKISQCKNCDMQQVCPSITMSNQDCYRAQCFATSSALATDLNLAPEQYITSFQSRLGRTPWIRPYTDELLTTLAQQGIKKLIIVCPSFVCDCLETLEEIGMRAREQWCKLGGEALVLVPCVNERAEWVEEVVLDKERDTFADFLRVPADPKD